jgi:hypothetical protein
MIEYKALGSAVNQSRCIWKDGSRGASVCKLGRADRGKNFKTMKEAEVHGLDVG